MTSTCNGLAVEYIVLSLTGVTTAAFQWRNNERDGVSFYRRLDCLPNRLFRHRSKKTWKLRVTGLCEGYSPVTGELPSQRASNAENISISHDDVIMIVITLFLYVFDTWLFHLRHFNLLPRFEADFESNRHKHIHSANKLLSELSLFSCRVQLHV